MAENTKIEWAHHTFNPWEGCAKVSPGCKNCYAEGQHRFMYASLAKGDNPGTCWGVNAPRLARSEDNWKKPLKWNAQAEAAGTRYRVFCASMADVFEEQSEISQSFAGKTARVPTGPEGWRTVTFADLDEQRLRLFELMRCTPHLDWLLLTKRPEHIKPLLMRLQLMAGSNNFNTPLRFWLMKWLEGQAPANVWLGTSVENQEQADIRVPQLLAVPATVRFLSCEPLLGPVDLEYWLTEPEGMCGQCGNKPFPSQGRTPEQEKSILETCTRCGQEFGKWANRLHWIIVGGESGPKARPMHPEWGRSLRDQCAVAEVPMLFKQWGEWLPENEAQRLCNEEKLDAFKLNTSSKMQGIWEATTNTWLSPVRPWAVLGQMAYRVGKQVAGRKLDGQLHDGFPVLKSS